MERRQDMDELFEAQVYLIDESGNPTGTVKDRKSKWVIDEAKKRGVDTLILLTYGNEGHSLGTAAKDTGIKVVCIVPSNLEERIKDILRVNSHVCDDFDLQRDFVTEQKRIEIARKLTSGSKIWDVTNKGCESYIPIIDEIKKFGLDYLIVPAGSFSLFYGLHLGIERHKLNTRLIAITSQDNPVVVLWEDYIGHIPYRGLFIDGEPFVKPKPSRADKLTTPYTPLATEIVKVTKMRCYHLYCFDEDDVELGIKTAKKCKIKSEPSASVVFGTRFSIWTVSEKVGVLNTGKGIYTR